MIFLDGALEMSHSEFFPEISINVAPFAQLFDLVRGDQSGIFSDPAPCFISREDETNLTPEERVLSTDYHKQWPILNHDYTGKAHASISRLSWCAWERRHCGVIGGRLQVPWSATFTCTNDFLRQGLAHILDRVADHYSVSLLPNMNNKVSNSTESDSDSGFVSPASVALPLARFFPNE